MDEILGAQRQRQEARKQEKKAKFEAMKERGLAPPTVEHHEDVF